MSLASGDLTTLSDARAYVNGAPSDVILSRYVSSVSRSILGYLNRGILVPQTRVTKFNGSGTTSLVLPQYPVISVDQLNVSGVIIPEAPVVNLQSTTSTTGYGYAFQTPSNTPPGDPSVLELCGAWYWYGNDNVVVTYRAGYLIPDETVTSATYSPLAPYGRWATDEGVTYSSTGATLVPGTGSTMPGVGTYIPPTPDATIPVETYLFNTTDVSSGLLASYGYVPADLEQAALDLINERAAYRKRPGIRSQMLAAQETITFETGTSGAADSGIPAYIRSYLAPYKSVLPPAIGASV